MNGQKINEDYLITAFERLTSKGKVESGRLVYSANTGKKLANINLSDIYTELIQNAGRFCERFASDVLYDIDEIKRLVNLPVDEDVDDFIVFAIREDGVDGKDYLGLNLHKHINDAGWCPLYYRRVYIVRIQRMVDGAITCTLKEVRDDVSYEFKKMVEEVGAFTD